MNSLDQFAKQSYLSLETKRKNGTAIATPVWFFQDVQTPNTFYVHTTVETGKVKRIRNNGSVRIMPCGQRGEPKGEWVDAKAIVLPEADGQRIDKLMLSKYGLMWRVFNLVGRLRRNQTVKIKIVAG